MRTQMKLMCCFVSNAKVSDAARLLAIRRGTVSEYYDNLRGEWYDWLEENPIEFVDGDEYEVDECLLKHIWNPYKRQFGVQWVSGIFERSTGKVLLYQVKKKSSKCLIPPILQHVPSGSWIYSDEWKSYGRLYNHPYIHLTVNHSKKEYAREENFGGRVVNVHINSLEQVNREIRRRFANKST